jgi:hypothetical protein
MRRNIYHRRRGISEIPAGIQIALGVAAFAGIMFITNYESAEDKALKPALVNDFYEASLEHCSRTSDISSATYEQRYKKTLNHAYTADLEKIAQRDIQICLDDRLRHQTKRFSDYRVAGIYYPEEKTLSVYDLGSKINGIFSSVGFYGERVPAEFVNDVIEGRMSMDDMSVSYRYTTSCGKSCTYTHIRFKSDTDMSDELGENPNLREAPVVKAPKV